MQPYPTGFPSSATMVTIPTGSQVPNDVYNGGLVPNYNAPYDIGEVFIGNDLTPDYPLNIKIFIVNNNIETSIAEIESKAIPIVDLTITAAPPTGQIWIQFLMPYMSKLNLSGTPFVSSDTWSGNLIDNDVAPYLDVPDIGGVVTHRFDSTMYAPRNNWFENIGDTKVATFGSSVRQFYAMTTSTITNSAANGTNWLCYTYGRKYQQIQQQYANGGSGFGTHLLLRTVDSFAMNFGPPLPQ